MKPGLVDRFPGLAALEIIYEDYADGCTRCHLHANRKHVVFGLGSTETPKIAIVGTGPDPADDRSGYPFTGETGEFLDRILVKGLDTCREDTYLCYAVCCAPKPGSRITPLHYQACQPVLLAQLRAVRPQVVLALGKAAGAALTGRETPELGVWYELSSGIAKKPMPIPVLVTHALGDMYVGAETLGRADAPLRRKKQVVAMEHCNQVRSALDGF